MCKLVETERFIHLHFFARIRITLIRLFTKRIAQLNHKDITNYLQILPLAQYMYSIYFVQSILTARDSILLESSFLKLVIVFQLCPKYAPCFSAINLFILRINNVTGQRRNSYGFICNNTV